MKQKLLSLVLALFMGVCIVYAQPSENNLSVEKPQSIFLKKGDPSPGFKKNIIKVNLLALAIKNYSAQYERILGRRSSLALGFRYMPVATLPFTSEIKKQIDKRATSSTDDVYETLNNAKIGNFAITPEYRYYLGKGYGKGFYLAPFYRYSQYEISDVKVEYGSDTEPKHVILNGDFSAHTLGLLLGAQWNLSKSITFDWWILGPSYGMGKGNGVGSNSKNFTEQDKIDIKRELDNLDIPLTNKTYEIGENSVRMKLDGPWAGVRAGLTLGIKF